MATVTGLFGCGKGDDKNRCVPIFYPFSVHFPDFMLLAEPTQKEPYSLPLRLEKSSFVSFQQET